MSASRARSTSSSISAFFRHQAQSQLSASENFTPYLSDIPHSFKASSGIKNSLTVPSYAIPNHLTRDRDSVTFLSPIKIGELPCHSLDENSRPPIADPKQSSLRFDNRNIKNPRVDLIYQILPVSRFNNILQHSTVTRDSELNTIAHTISELKFEVTVNFND